MKVNCCICDEEFEATIDEIAEVNNDPDEGHICPNCAEAFSGWIENFKPKDN